MDRPYFLALLADVLLTGGEQGAALAVVEQALGEIAPDRSFFYEAELHRLRGIAQAGLGLKDDALLNLRRALEVAREQEAKALELRAATSLARELRSAGSTQEARAVLAPVLDWFSEGLDTPDLAEAREVLSSLAE